MNEEIVCELSVCGDCLHTHASGDRPIDRPIDAPEPFSLIPFGYSVTMGGDELGFTWTSCDACGDTLAGDRYAMTLWRATRATMLRHWQDGFSAARSYRRGDMMGAARLALDYAARWRVAMAN